MPAPVTNETANAWVTETQSCRQQDEGEDVMLSLEGSRTDENLKRAVLDEARFDRRYLRHELAAEAAGHRDLAAMLRAAGLARVSFQPMTGGIVALHSGWRL